MRAHDSAKTAAHTPTQGYRCECGVPHPASAVYRAATRPRVVGAIFLEETLPRSARRGCCGGGLAVDASAEGALVRQLSQAHSERACGADPTGTPRWQPPDPDEEGLLASPFFPDAPHGRQGQRRPSQASPRSTGMPFGLLEATPPASEPSLDNSSAREVSPAVLEAPSHHGQSFPRVLIQVIAAYCAIGGFASANGQMFVLIVSIPASSGGFGLGPATIGLLQNVAAVGLLLTQCLLYAPSTRRFGYFYTFYAEAEDSGSRGAP
ncbi:unnamed protein product, partial [Prorocentrum cordatum]